MNISIGYVTNIMFCMGRDVEKT